ncbi:hypothetical protein M408DRAFT_330072 [Serendipita vermifera MAFF 305830]|uniref:Glutathione S-transferase C-terminal domain-containing protein n=1 Tax=Serendipita vermifera MAFF 305830 TaxID=933852 RepID=A0A0C3AS10_SERVB|nr:hypothetical protein M408DRAFT_330072 [Serendipita vermifera MAFF 305830]
MTKSPHYTLHYWGGIPGRGEFVRLVFEFTETHYKDPKKPAPLLSNTGATSHPPHCAPPILELSNGSYISQTANILAYLAPRLGLDGVTEGMSAEDADVRRAHVNQLVLTICDLNDEAHDVHHPISNRLYYDDQKPEAARRATEFRSWRLPKFLSYFALVLRENAECSNASGANAPAYPRVIGTKTTTADIALFHVMNGLEHAFPKRTAALRQDEGLAEVWKLVDGVREEPTLKAYLGSKRRAEFGQGIFRHYPELDGDE